MSIASALIPEFDQEMATTRCTCSGKNSDCPAWRRWWTPPPADSGAEGLLFPACAPTPGTHRLRTSATPPRALRPRCARTTGNSEQALGPQPLGDHDLPAGPQPQGERAVGRCVAGEAAHVVGVDRRGRLQSAEHLDPRLLRREHLPHQALRGHLHVDGHLARVRELYLGADVEPGAIRVLGSHKDAAAVRNLLVGAGITTEKASFARGGPTSRMESVRVSLVDPDALAKASLRVIEGGKKGIA